VVKVALAHHLVSAYTSLVAVDVMPTGPAGSTNSAVVKANLPRAALDLPQTDAAASLHFLLGLAALLAAAAMAVAGRRPRGLA
jgi:Ca-activated chloride channel family protein